MKMMIAALLFLGCNANAIESITPAQVADWVSGKQIKEISTTEAEQTIRMMHPDSQFQTRECIQALKSRSARAYLGFNTLGMYSLFVTSSGLRGLLNCGDLIYHCCPVRGAA